MKKIDWYILKKFLGTFVFIIVLLNLITVVVDVSEKIDNFLDGSATVWEIIFSYYLAFIPYISSMLAPFFVLVAVIFFTSQLADRSEIIAILNSGTSYYRMLLPYGVGALILGGGLWVCNNYLVPMANHKRLLFESTYINKFTRTLSYNYHRQISPGTFMYVENYRPADAVGSRFSIDKFENGKMVTKLRSESIAWDTIKKTWRVKNYYIRELHPEGDVIRTGASMDSLFSFRPENFAITTDRKDEMTTPALKDFIRHMQKAGSNDIEFYEVELYRRTSGAFSVLIMTLIGVSLASRKIRGGLGWHLVLGIALCATFEIIMKFSITFSTNASLPPFIGVWIPNFLFGIIAFYLLKTAPK
ncbi:MAG: LptF/LptG family permease [Bacteroidetes bacterium]|nr:LptF/LptG family permease [Bacteroidota bacterium]